MLAEPLIDIQLDVTESKDQPVAEVHDAGTTRAQIERLESHLVGLPQVEIPATHRFAPGLYCREIRIPAGTLMTGRVHRFEHVSVMVSGEMTTLVDGEMKRIAGYHPFIAPAGTKRVGYTHTEVIWLTVHLNPDELRDIAQIEAVLCEPMHLTPDRCRLAREDFSAFLTEFQIDVRLMEEQVHNPLDQAPFPAGEWPVDLRESGIHGTGLFASCNFPAGTLIAPARVDGMRTPAGRYTNHSILANARMSRKGDDIDLLATRGIAAGEEILIDYREALSLAMEAAACQQ